MKILAVIALLFCAGSVFFDDPELVQSALIHLLLLGAGGIVLYGIFQVLKESIISFREDEKQ